MPPVYLSYSAIAEGFFLSIKQLQCFFTFLCRNFLYIENNVKTGIFCLKIIFDSMSLGNPFLPVPYVHAMNVFSLFSHLASYKQIVNEKVIPLLR